MSNNILIGSNSFKNVNVYQDKSNGFYFIDCDFEKVRSTFKFKEAALEFAKTLSKNYMDEYLGKSVVK